MRDRFLLKIESNLISWALILCSFSVWLALTEYIRISFLLLGAAFFISFFDKKRRLFRFPKKTFAQRLFLIIFLLFVFISFNVNSIIRPQPKVFSNFVGTFAIVIFFYFCYSSLVEKYISLERCIKSLAYAGVLLMSVIVIDAILVNFFNYEIQPLLIIGQQANFPYFNRSIWISTSAPTEEPAYAITFLNILAPFIFYYYKGTKLKLLCAGYIFCLFSAFSATAIATVALLPFILLFTNIPSRLRAKILFAIVISVFILFIFLINTPFLSNFIAASNLIQKVTMSGETMSDSQRSEAMLLALEHGIMSPVYGMGPGYGKSVTGYGYLSLFLTMLGNYGFIAFFAFILFWLDFYRKCRGIDKKIRIYFIMSFIVCSIASVINDNIHDFIIWALFPIINKAYNENLKRKRHDTSHNPLLLAKQ